MNVDLTAQEMRMIVGALQAQTRQFHETVAELVRSGDPHSQIWEAVCARALLTDKLAKAAMEAQQEGSTRRAAPSDA
jgi:hypothetical protein